MLAFLLALLYLLYLRLRGLAKKKLGIVLVYWFHCYFFCRKLRNFIFRRVEAASSPEANYSHQSNVVLQGRRIVKPKLAGYEWTGVVAFRLLGGHHI